jgi:hypothetical protein
MPAASTSESLDSLLARAERYASFAMRQFGRVPPTLLALSPGGSLCFMPDSLADERAKSDFANTARLICIAHGATAAVLVAEAWMRAAPPGGTLDTSEPPSEALDRREVVILMGESRARQKQKFLPIIRTDAGGFFGFGEFTGPASDRVQGRFAQILPPQEPTPQIQAHAKELLARLGIADTSLHTGPRGN